MAQPSHNLEPDRQDGSLAPGRKKAQSRSPRQHPRSGRRWFSSWWSRVSRRDQWSSEIASLIFCVAVVVCIVITLKWSDGRPVSSWKLSITLNALLSLLVTILYYPLSSVVSKCVYQLQWNHFSTVRQLSDFETLHKAGGGVIGASVALFSRSPRLIFRAATCLTIAVAAIGPFTQQILGLDSALVSTSANASLLVSRLLASEQLFPPKNQRSSTGVNGENITEYLSFPAFNKGLRDGAFAANATNFAVSPHCSTGKCTWTNYTTFALRSQSRNATESLHLASADEVKIWLNTNSSAKPANTSSTSLVTSPITSATSRGINLDVLQQCLPSAGINHDAAGIMRLNCSMYDWQKVSAFETFDPLPSSESGNQMILEVMIYYAIVNVEATKTAASVWSNVSIAYPTIVAWHVIFDLVTQQFTARQDDGVLRETEVGDPKLYDGPDCTLEPPGIGENFVNCTFEDEIFAASLSAQQNLATMMFAQLSGSVISGLTVFSSSGVDRFYYQGSTSSPCVTCFQTLQTIETQADNSSDPSFLTVADMMGNIARSLTFWMRTTQGQSVFGETHQEVTVYKVEWQWLAAPALLIVSIACLFVYTAWETRKKRVPVWTDSALAALVHGVDNNTRADLVHLGTTEELEKACKNIKVVFQGKEHILGNMD